MTTVPPDRRHIVPRLDVKVSYPQGGRSSSLSALFHNPLRPFTIYVDSSTPNFMQVTSKIKNHGGDLATHAMLADIVIMTANERTCQGPIFTEFCHPAWLSSEFKVDIIRRIIRGTHTAHWMNKVVLEARWLDACIAANAFLGEDDHWGHCRVGSPPADNQLFNVWAIPSDTEYLDLPPIDLKCHDCGDVFTDRWRLEYHLADSVPCWTPLEERPSFIPRHGIPLHRLLPASTPDNPVVIDEDCESDEESDREYHPDFRDPRDCTVNPNDIVDIDPPVTRFRGSSTSEASVENTVDPGGRLFTPESSLRPMSVALAAADAMQVDEEPSTNVACQSRGPDKESNTLVQSETADITISQGPEALQEGIVPTAPAQDVGEEDMDMEEEEVEQPQEEVSPVVTRPAEATTPVSPPVAPPVPAPASVPLANPGDAEEEDELESSDEEIPLAELSKRARQLKKAKAARRSSVAMPAGSERESSTSSNASASSSLSIGINSFFAGVNIWLDNTMDFNLRKNFIAEIPTVGGHVVDDWDKATHVVLAKYNASWQPLIKGLQARGNWTLHMMWLSECLRLRRRVEEKLHVVSNGNPNLPYVVPSKLRAREEASQKERERANRAAGLPPTVGTLPPVVGALPPVVGRLSTPSRATPPAPSASAKTPRASATASASSLAAASSAPAPSTAPAPAVGPATVASVSSTVSAAPAASAPSTSSPLSAAARRAPSAVPLPVRTRVVSDSSSAVAQSINSDYESDGSDDSGDEEETAMRHVMKHRFARHFEGYTWSTSEMSEIFTFEHPIICRLSGPDCNGYTPSLSWPNLLSASEYLEKKYGGVRPELWFTRFEEWKSRTRRFSGETPATVPSYQEMLDKDFDPTHLPTCMLIKLLALAFDENGRSRSATFTALRKEHRQMGNSEWRNLLHNWRHRRGQFKGCVYDVPAKGSAIETPASRAVSRSRSATPTLTRAASVPPVGPSRLNPSAQRPHRASSPIPPSSQAPPPGSRLRVARRDAASLAVLFSELYPKLRHMPKGDIGLELARQDTARTYTAATWAGYWNNWLLRRDRFKGVFYILPVGAMGTTLTNGRVVPPYHASPPPEPRPKKRAAEAVPEAPAAKRRQTQETATGYEPLSRNEIYAMAIHMHTSIPSLPNWNTFHKVNPHRSVVEWISLGAGQHKGSPRDYLRKILVENWWPAPSKKSNMEWPVKGKVNGPVACGPDSVASGPASSSTKQSAASTPLGSSKSRPVPAADASTPSSSEAVRPTAKASSLKASSSKSSLTSSSEASSSKTPSVIPATPARLTAPKAPSVSTPAHASSSKVPSSVASTPTKLTIKEVAAAAGPLAAPEKANMITYISKNAGNYNHPAFWYDFSREYPHRSNKQWAQLVSKAVRKLAERGRKEELEARLSRTAQEAEEAAVARMAKEAEDAKKAKEKEVKKARKAEEAKKAEDAKKAKEAEEKAAKDARRARKEKEKDTPARRASTPASTSRTPTTPGASASRSSASSSRSSTSTPATSRSNSTASIGSASSTKPKIGFISPRQAREELDAMAAATNARARSHHKLPPPRRKAPMDPRLISERGWLNGSDGTGTADAPIDVDDD